MYVYIGKELYLLTSEASFIFQLPGTTADASIDQPANKSLRRQTTKTSHGTLTQNALERSVDIRARFVYVKLD
jgi:hypothetical protein